jgi:hypothetical protein
MQQERRLDTVTIAPPTRLVLWCERVEVEPVAGVKRYGAGRSHARLVLPVPMWLAKAVSRLSRGRR